MKYIIIASIIILGIFLGILLLIPFGVEPLTEVYFENHAELPKDVGLNEINSFSFVVHNLEHEKMNYEYIIEMYDKDEKFVSQLSKGEFSLEEDRKKVIYQEFSFDELFEDAEDRSKINIKIIKRLNLGKSWFEKRFWWENPDYSKEIEIYFWVENVRDIII